MRIKSKKAEIPKFLENNIEKRKKVKNYLQKLFIKKCYE